MRLATPGNIALVAVLLSGILHMAAAFLPRPWSTLGHIDIAQLLYDTPIFRTHWPYWTFPFEYHPVIGWGSAVLSFLTGDLALLVSLWIVIVALCARAVGAIVADLVGPRRAVVFWSLSPQLVLFAPANFDTIAVLCILVGSVLAARRAIVAGIALGIGGATKIFPLAAAAPLVLSFLARGRRRAALLLSVGAGVALAVLDVPAILAPFSLLRYGVTPYSVATWNPDSIWLPVAMVLDLFVDPSRADDLIALATVVGLVGTFGALVVWPALRGVDPHRLVWLAVASIVFWTRLRSPQYAVWLLPLFALYAPDARLLWFMFVGDVVSFVAVFALRGAPRDVLAPDSLPLLAVIVFGAVIRQIAVGLLILRVWRRPDGAVMAA